MPTEEFTSELAMVEAIYGGAWLTVRNDLARARV
jgi:hypothetical protein